MPSYDSTEGNVHLLMDEGFMLMTQDENINGLLLGSSRNISLAILVSFPLILTSDPITVACRRQPCQEQMHTSFYAAIHKEVST